MTETHEGSCLCGGVTFRIEGSFQGFFLCHCSRCRKATGSAHASNLFSTTAKVSWLTGEELLVHYDVPGTRHSRCFCKACGSPLPNVQPEHGRVLVPAGCLNTPVEIKPNAHIFTASRANWDDRLEEVVSFDTLPPGLG
ncbi:GFA family protein [uncultured Cohaesibacter sp.]|uniref:GFA family protein n=1 Tax=uncultured Cohaesibacter sp. TaxID=1002546 RepID=UPI0029C724D9|nr:GFA family protein [uncultured Cohaesibacter sp.]